jgi:putative FmdB family regulatory protein
MMHAMPVYEYACTSCGERTEAKQSFDDPPLDVCPHCGGKLRKLYSPVGVVFKGSGFYSTDARSKAASSSTDKSSGSEKKDKAESKKEAPSGKKEKSD